MRTAELGSAAALMLFAIVLMVHATVLPIGWVEGSGPGGGAFPFWLAAGMLITGAVIFVRELRPTAAAKQKARIYIDPQSYAQLAVTAGAIVVTVGLMMWLGTYVALPLFLLFYLKLIGRHGWVLTLAITLLTPVFLFFFFEVTLKILLPKGITEPLFFPLYAMFF
jgi:hypothetical protein